MKYVLNASNCIIVICDYLCIVPLQLDGVIIFGGAQYIFLYKCIYYYIKLIFLIVSNKILFLIQSYIKMKKCNINFG